MEAVYRPSLDTTFLSHYENVFFAGSANKSIEIDDDLHEENEYPATPERKGSSPNHHCCTNRSAAHLELY